MFNRDFKKSVKKVSPAVGKLLEAYRWPGNVRELKNVIERAMLLEAEDELLPEHLPAEVAHGEAPVVAAAAGSSLGDLYPISLESMERILIEKTLAESAGNKSKAARVLGISRQTLREKIKLYRIE